MYEEDNQLVVELDGQTVLHPEHLMQKLAKRLRKRQLQDLEQRLSTNTRKNKGEQGGPAPEYAISWGTVGTRVRDRREMLVYLGPKSTFSDREICIIQSLRLALWPTKARDAVRAGHTDMRCECGAIQTVTHLLNVPEENEYHGEALRAIPKSRHAAGLRALWTAILAGDLDHGWGFVRAESRPTGLAAEPHGLAAEISEKIASAARRGLLGGDANATKHYKPDGILVRQTGNRRDIIILDFCYGSDDKIATEESFIDKQGAGPRGANVWLSDLFDHEGRWTGRQDGAAAAPRGTCKHARYHRRYRLLRELLAHEPGLRCTAKILVIVVGVAGSIPRFTERYLATFLPKPKIKTLKRALIINSYAYAVKAYNAWTDET